MYITHHPDALGIYTEFFHILNNFDLDVSIEYKVYDGCREGTGCPIIKFNFLIAQYRLISIMSKPIKL